LEFKDYDENKNNLTRENIIKLGMATGEQTSDDKAYRKGCDLIRIPKSDIKDKLREKGLTDKALIVLPYEKYGGIDDIDPENDSLLKSRLTKMAHIIESSAEKQIKFFLGKSEKLPLFLDTGRLNEGFDNHIGSPKPCINGSDSHTPDTIGKFPSVVRQTLLYI